MKLDVVIFSLGSSLLYTVYSRNGTGPVGYQSRYLPYPYSMNCNSFTLEHSQHIPTSQIITTSNIHVCTNFSDWNTNYKFQKLNLSSEIAI